MQAVVRERYGSAEVLDVVETERPEAPDEGVLVRVHATSLNRVDWYAMTGTPYVGRLSSGLRTPKDRVFTADFAGTVEAAGKDFPELRAGDEVFGRCGAFAEYAIARKAVALKPSNLTFEEAAAVPLAGLTALQGLRDHAQVQAGQKVLVNGASGGVGTFAVQIAKALGAEVTAVCSTRNVDLAASLGADHVVDYTREDFTRSGRRYDVLFDNAGSRSWRACKRVLEPRATVLLVGGPKRNPLLGPLGHMVGMKLAAAFGKRKAVFFIADLNGPDLEALRAFLEAGTIAPVIDRRYELSETADAMRYLGEGHARGKITIRIL
jgi:NADPH:quinone reductase-like Zn-dependent oxidoreductase